ncbi:MAG: hypothetical protein V3T24_10980, partial [Longimicrobiales bacterium]
GVVHTYQVKTTAGDIEIIVVEVLPTTRVVAGVECAIVRDRVFCEDLLVEDTYDWYAQDQNGNVWYMGEEVTNYEYDDDGNLIGTDSAGAWEAGQDVAGVGSNAIPGIIMKTSFVVGDTYQQEFYAGEAEDRGEIFALDVAVTLADGTAYTCLQTRDTNPLDPGVVEFKYFAPGVGVVLEEKEDLSERSELRGRFNLNLAESLPDIGTATFSNPTQVTDSFLSYLTETARTFVDSDEDAPETIVVEVQTTTRIVNGVESLVVRDRVFADELLVEDTLDWYAQDDLGNVWYMGEEVVNYEYDDDGNLIGTDSGGSWEAGVDGAEPGIVMWASPVVGQPYHQEYYADEAEDMAVVVAMGASVILDDGRAFNNCRQILEWTPLEPYALEYKFYAPGVGVVLEQPLHAGTPVQALGTFDTSLNSLPNFNAVTFSNPSQITHNFLPYTPGGMWTYEKMTGGGLEQTIVEVLVGTRIVNGVESAVVRDRVFEDGLLVEDTQDWYAQDDLGNVWYMGEEVINYEYDDDDNLIGTDNDGSWEAGVDGAEPGIVMWATPILGLSYRQEFYEDEAEDMGLLIATGVEVELQDGTTFQNCLQILEWTPLEPSALEYKYFAPGIGLVLEEPLPDGHPAELKSAP